MNYFEYFIVKFVLTICPLMIYNEKFREERKYILNEIQNNRGIL